LKEPKNTLVLLLIRYELSLSLAAKRKRNLKRMSLQVRKLHIKTFLSLNLKVLFILNLRALPKISLSPPQVQTDHI